LAHYSRTNNEALVLEISRCKEEIILAIRHVEEFDEPHRQFFELLALWFVRTLHTHTNRHFNPLRITFTHARNSDLREVHRLLQCPVDFAQAVDSWVLPQRVVDLPIVSADSYLLPILTAHAEHLVAERRSVSGLQSMVEIQLVDLLPSGESRVAAVAQRLGMSTRSFTRHLAEEGTSFGEFWSGCGSASPPVTWEMTACLFSRSLGYSAIRSLGRSLTPTKGGPEQRPGERESLLWCRHDGPLPSCSVKSPADSD
jgi:hypothetical protein